MFRRRFLWSLALSVPVVVTSHMVMDWFGYDLDFAGIEWIGPVLGGTPFFGPPGTAAGALGGYAGMLRALAFAIALCFMSVVSGLVFTDLSVVALLILGLVVGCAGLDNRVAP